MLSENCILLFLRHPERGRVKSRLAKDLDKDSVFLLYDHFVLDLLATLEKRRYSLRICFHPPESERKVRDWLGEHYTYMPQHGQDLGERMKNAFIETFKSGGSKVVLIGSDVPDITTEIVDAAFELDPYDAVIGPALDGGYYLIGFKHDTFLPYIFEGIKWGTSTVFEDTLHILESNDCQVKVLPEWRDVDFFDDLMDLFERNQDTAFAQSKTMTFLNENLKELLVNFKRRPK
ncbi:MAG: TIGR04282 family arsenosugar biosynthesis glycosyltransferase [Dissulfurispiraceae bacterium]